MLIDEDITLYGTTAVGEYQGRQNHLQSFLK